MNKIHNLFDESFVLNFFRKNLLPLYPSFVDIKKIKIKPYKKMVWTSTYHVVIEFETYFLTPEKKINKIRIICSAHSEESRENVFGILDYLWNSPLNSKPIELPRPLFYSEEFRGVFYRALRGRNVLSLLKEGNILALEKKIIMAAEFFSRLHNLPFSDDLEFNPGTDRIETVVPGRPAVLREMSLRYNKLYDRELEAAYNFFTSQENENLKNKENKRLIHGDAHLENLIDTGRGRLGVIDFSDFCRADFARDIGTFLQQVEYKVLGKLNDPALAERLKKIFLDKYLSLRKLELTEDLQLRINLYYNWTAVRTAVYLFMKFDGEPNRAATLLSKVTKDMNLSLK